MAVAAAPRVGWLVAIIVVAAGLGGCVTWASEGAAMKGDIGKLKQRLDDLDRRNVEAKEQTDRLRVVLDQATVLLTRNSADVGAKVAKHEQDIALATGKIEEATHLLEQLQKRLSEADARLGTIEGSQQKIIDRVAPSMPEDKEKLWAEAMTRNAQGSRDDARRFLNGFTQRFPDDPRVPQARIIIGQSYMVEGKFTPAAGEFQKVLDKYPKAPEVPEAMWNMGQAFVELKFCKDAQALLEDLARRYPKSPRAVDAKKKKSEVQKILKDKKLCTS